MTASIPSETPAGDEGSAEAPLSQLIGAFAGKAGALAQAELVTLRVEMRGKMRSAARSLLGLLAAAAFFLGAAAMALACAFFLLVDLGLRKWLAAAALALLAAFVGALLLRAGVGGLRRLRWAPERTLAGLRRDACILRTGGKSE